MIRHTMALTLDSVQNTVRFSKQHGSYQSLFLLIAFQRPLCRIRIFLRASHFARQLYRWFTLFFEYDDGSVRKSITERHLPFGYEMHCEFIFERLSMLELIARQL